MSTLTLAKTRTWSAARIGAAGLATFFVASIGTAAVTPGYRTTRDAISALAATDSPYAYVMIAGFMAAAAGLFATGIALWKRYGARPSGKVAAVIVMLCSGLMVAAGLARQDCSEAVGPASTTARRRSRRPISGCTSTSPSPGSCCWSSPASC